MVPLKVMCPSHWSEILVCALLVLRYLSLYWAYEVAEACVWYTSLTCQDQQYSPPRPLLIYSSTLKVKENTSNMHVENQFILYLIKIISLLKAILFTNLLTSCAFVFNPFNESPRHCNQNLSSECFKADGFRPQSKLPGMSSSDNKCDP